MNLGLATNIEELEVVINNRNLHKDLHIFMNYIQERDVKRTHRNNSLNKSDAIRLVKLMNDSNAMKEVKKNGFSSWVDFIDELTLNIDFTSYDLEGTYVGYTSTEPSFPDNYIKFREKKFKRFLNSSPIEQEDYILNTLIDKCDYSNNEFFQRPRFLSILDNFRSQGCAIGAVPSVKFNEVRRFLLNLLKDCKSNTWYTTESFIQYLKKNHPFFLIPKDFLSRGYGIKARYWNFREFKDSSSFGEGKEIPANAPDAFERVEGRYVERFLEYIPFVMHYVDVAYDPEYEWNRTTYPSMNQLMAFKVNERFLRVMRKQIQSPRVAILPNFEIHIDSDVYPINEMSKLGPFTEVITNDTSIILKLTKKKVADQLVKYKDLDVISLLRQLSNREIPSNVMTEIKEWATHSETFTLFEGFGLLEHEENLKLPDGFIVENISPTLKLVRVPNELFSRLESVELVPLIIEHLDAFLLEPTKGSRSVFLKRAPIPKKQQRQVTLKREFLITLSFPSKSIFKRFSQELKNAEFPFEMNELTLSITFSKSRDSLIKRIFNRLDEYIIDVEDIE